MKLRKVNSWNQWEWLITLLKRSQPKWLYKHWGGDGSENDAREELKGSDLKPIKLDQEGNDMIWDGIRERI